MEPTTETEAIEELDIDAEIDAILNEDVTPDDSDGSSDDGTQTEPGSDPLLSELTTLGLTDVNSEDLTPEMRALASRIVEKANSRVTGFQSGFDKTREEFGAKAKVYDQLFDMPEFRTWLDGVRNGNVAPPAAAPVAEEKGIDFNNLPTDPAERIEVLMGHFAEKVIKRELAPLTKRLDAVGNVMGSIGWQNFVASHPDAPALKPEIDRLIARGHSAEEAYRYAKGAATDPEAIEDAVLERFKKRYKARKEASGLGLPKDSSGRGGTDVGSDLVAFAKEHGDTAAVLEGIRRAQEESGFSF